MTRSYRLGYVTLKSQISNIKNTESREEANHSQLDNDFSPYVTLHFSSFLYRLPNLHVFQLIVSGKILQFCFFTYTDSLTGFVSIMIRDTEFQLGVMEERRRILQFTPQLH